MVNRTNTRIEVEGLTQTHVQTAKTAARRGVERAFDGHAEIGDGIHRIIGQPVVEKLLGLAAGEDLEPGDVALAAIGGSHRRVYHPAGGEPDFRTDTIPFDEGNDGVVGHHRGAIDETDARAFGSVETVVFPGFRDSRFHRIYLLISIEAGAQRKGAPCVLPLERRSAARQHGRRLVQHPAFVVVYVLAQEIYPAGGADRAVLPLEPQP